MPEPTPTPAPFPVESESEKIKRLTEENDKLKQENINLQVEISTLKNENLRLQEEISGLNYTIRGLKEVTMEQIRVIMDLANRLKDILFEKIFSPTINL
jgi:predicted RNase H-like nuclease (RuvC/YqgF family)